MEENVLGLYKGLGGSLVQVVPNVSVNLCAYETLRSYWLSHHPETVSPGTLHTLLAPSNNRSQVSWVVLYVGVPLELSQLLSPTPSTLSVAECNSKVNTAPLEPTPPTPTPFTRPFDPAACAPFTPALPPNT